MDFEPNLDVFISYNHADEEIARKIAEYLESKKIGERKVRVFFASWDVKPGDNFVDKIDESLAKAKFFALLLSPDALNAKWPVAERAASLLSDPSGRMGRVISILVKSCKIPPLLAIRRWIDLRDMSRFEVEMEKLLYRIRGEALPRGEATPERDVVEMDSSAGSMESKASEPDKVDEILHANLFSVTKLPSAIWSAPTIFERKYDVYAKFKNSSSPFILKDKYLYTFSNLSKETNQLRLAVDVGEINFVNIKKWFNDKNKSRWLVELLGCEAKQFCKNRGLYFDHIGKQFYGDKKIVSDKKFSWLVHVKTGKRGLIIPFTKTNKDSGKEITYFYRHRAVELRFQLLGDELFLWIEPGWVFSTDGSILITGKRKSVLNTKLQSQMKNDAEFDEMRFWAWILSDGTKIKMGSDDAVIEIDSKPLSFKTSYGVYGDCKPIPNVVQKPPPLVEEKNGYDAIVTDKEMNGDTEEVRL